MTWGIFKRGVSLPVCGLVFLCFFVLAPYTADALTISPTLYVNPASVAYSGANGTQHLFLYFEEGASPICDSAGMSDPPAAGDIATDVCTGQGSFPGDVDGAYQLLQPHVASCAGDSFATCFSENGGDIAEADFSIYSATSAPATTTQTTMAFDPVFNATLLFMLSMFFMIWLMRK